MNSKRITYCLIAILIILAILYRYPLDIDCKPGEFSPFNLLPWLMGNPRGGGYYPVNYHHEVGADGTLTHITAGILVQKAHAPWVVHPLSYFGLYALSNPSGISFLLAEQSLAGNIDLEVAILVLGMVFSILGALGTYIFAREIKNSHLFAFLAAVLFSSAPFFIFSTSWVGSTRAYVVGLFPLFCWLLVRHLKTYNTSYLGLALLLLVIMATIHRIGFLASFVFLAYLFTTPVHTLTRQFRISFFRYDRVLKLASFILIVALFVGIFYLQILYPELVAGSSMVEAYKESTFFKGQDPLSLLLNMAVNYTGKLGLLTGLTLFGIFVLAFQRRREQNEKFLILSLLFLIPFLPLRAYMSVFIAPLISVVIAVGLYALVQRYLNRRKLVAVVVITSILVSGMFGWVFKDYWRRSLYTDTPIGDDTYATAVYMALKMDGTTTTGEPIVASRLAAVSGLPTLPLGGISMHFQSPFQLAYGYLTTETMSVRIMKFSEITTQTDTIVIAENTPNPFHEWAYEIMRRDCERVEIQLDSYNVRYALALKAHQYDGKIFFSEWLKDESKFLISVNEKRYRVFENNENTIWFVQYGRRAI